MRINRKLILFSLATSVLLSLVVTRQFGLVGGEDDMSHGEQQNSKSGFSLSKLFDFKSFKRLFKKSYQSPVEESRREKTFTSNLLRSFVSKVAYKHKQTESYLSVNSMSDWTAEEFDKTLIDQKVYLEAASAAQTDQQTLAQLFVNDVDSDDDDDDDEEEEEDNDSQEMDLENAKANGKDESKRTGSNLRKYLKKMSLNNLRLTDKWHSLSKKISDKSIEARNNAEGFMWRAFHNLPKRTDLPDEVFIDHRESGCLTIAKNQRQCGSCYVFSTLALYEWAYCRLTGKQVRFSEQYVIDCGKRMKMAGCRGGAEPRVAKFIEKYGFETTSDIFYMGKEAICPYDKLKDDDDGHVGGDGQPSKEAHLFEGDKVPEQLGDDSMGMFRINKPKLFSVGLGGIEKQLRISPVVIAVRTSGNFQHYGGGVDMGRGCEKKHALHSMLIVGHGRQSGIEYWLIRNSHGFRWGEDGHWKLAKNNNCYTVANSGMALKALDYHRAPQQLVNSSTPLIQLEEAAADHRVVVYNFTENPKHDRRYVYYAVSKIIRKTGPIYIY